MAKKFVTQRYLSVADIFIFFLLGATIYGVVSLGTTWRAEFHPVTDIDLSIGALPRYAFFSGLRGLAAYILSLIFTLVVGFAAAKSKRAERVLIPMLDILQSVPVLAFLPGLVLGLITIFPKTNTGIELAAIIMIFTGQVWNMTFSFYSSLKSLPQDYHEASSVIGLNWWQKFIRLELPFSAVGLAWNSLMSMAGGWFFLSICEAFTLGNLEYRLPGIGAYMAVALKQGDTKAMFYGVVAMITVILTLDFVIWHPVLSWVRRFRLEEVPGQEGAVDEPLMLLAIRESRVLRWVNQFYRRNFGKKKKRRKKRETSPVLATVNMIAEKTGGRFLWQHSLRFSGPLLLIAGAGMAILGAIKLGHVLSEVDSQTWLSLSADVGMTFLRVLGSLIISSVWAVPVGIWIGLSPKRTRIAQPIIQVLASFPAPMLYPLALALFFGVGMGLGVGSMLLMLLGVQWYVLFNVLAGALRISQELGDTLSLMQTSTYDRWRVLYLPSVLPALVTGWITAAGGAWNASIAAEYIAYKGQLLTTRGIGATISLAAAAADFKLLAASLTVVVIVVVLLNRTFWRKIYAITQTRFRMD